jgi:hypothetical protein
MFLLSFQIIIKIYIQLIYNRTYLRHEDGHTRSQEDITIPGYLSESVILVM